MLWVDPTDPSVFLAVTGLENDCGDADEDQAEAVRWAVAAASDILTELTAHRIHPAGTSEEEFICTQRLRQMRPVYGPVKEIISVTQQHPLTGEQTPLDGAWTLVQGAIHFFGPRRTTALPFRHVLADCAPDRGLFRVHYRFGSTVSAGARMAVLEYAHQLWLAVNGEDGCQLPDRVMSLSREGISMEMLDPQDYLDRGKVGLPRVDTWLAGVNQSGKARRPARLYSADAPPSVPTRVTVARG